MLSKFGYLEEETGYHANLSISILEEGIPCPYVCIIYSVRHNSNSARGRRFNHPIAFSSRNFSTTKHNYTTTKCEGLEMVYALQKFRNYILGSSFNMYMDHYALRYLVNKSVLGRKICR